MITHPDKVLFPEDGITKGEMAAYYDAIAPLMLPHIRRRPITMERFPSGIGRKGFIQKDVSKGFPAWLKRIETPKKGGVVNYPLANDQKSLEWLVNQNAITLHVWTSRVPNLGRPDVCVFDLDPSEDDEDALREAALWVRDVLEGMNVASWVKTSGSKGFHIVTPVKGRATFDTVSGWSGKVAATLVARHPKTFTTAFSKADRGGRIYLDVARNRPGATFAAVYTVRARAGAPVSAPCTWDEIKAGRVGPRSFTLRNMAARVAKVGDLWAPIGTRR